jgi:hypothetical protein
MAPPASNCFEHECCRSNFPASAEIEEDPIKGNVTAIPYRKTTKMWSRFFPKTLYNGRARIEQAIGKLIRFTRVVLHCEMTAKHYASFVVPACAFIWTLLLTRPYCVVERF